MKYKVIMADPPWNYSNSGCRGAAENQYPTMRIEDICNLEVKNIAEDDSVLLLWCTWPQLLEGLRVMKSWGFKYITGFPWIKVTNVSKTLFGKFEISVPYGIGFWARGCSEYILIGKRGKPKPPPNGFIGLLSPNLFHSRKPKDLYHYAESMEGPYIELFARVKREGWDIWGNELDNDITLVSPTAATSNPQKPAPQAPNERADERRGGWL